MKKYFIGADVSKKTLDYKDEIKPMSLKDDKIVELSNLMNDRKMAVMFKLICRAFAVIRYDKPYVIVEKDAA